MKKILKALGITIALTTVGAVIKAVIEYIEIEIEFID